MILKRVAVAMAIALGIPAAPAAGLAGAAFWQQHAPDSFRQAVLTVSAWTEPARSPGDPAGARDKPIELAVDTTAVNPG